MAVAAVRLGFGTAPWRTVRPYPETLACLGLALAWRLPAIAHPWGWVNRDGAYGAFVALHLQQGLRPAPVFTEGANYQGTLKPHLAAMFGLFGVDDLSRAMVLAGVVLSLLLVASAMALARRVGGRVAGAAAGLFLAVSSRFVTVFSLNAVGQYIDVLALGTLALALVAGIVEEDHPARGRARAAAAGWLLGTAFWQQPVALSYLVAALAALGLRRRSWRDGVLGLALLGVVVGALPVVLWNVQNDWASGDIMGRDAVHIRAQVDALPRLARRAATISFPILAGVTPGHPWAHHPLARGMAVTLIPGLFLAYLAATRGAEIREAFRGRPRAALLAPVLAVSTLLLFWAVASGRVYWRPRYLLPVVAATAIHLGVAGARLWARSRVLAGGSLAALLAVHVVGTWPRLSQSAGIAEHYRSIVRSLEQKGVRHGYADFSISAPVTMFTAERILLSSQLGPTPAYESDLHRRRVEEEGADAFVLRVDEDPAPFAAGLDALGVSYQFDPEPMPVFYRLSRRVRVEEVRGLVGGPREEAE